MAPPGDAPLTSPSNVAPVIPEQTGLRVSVNADRSSSREPLSSPTPSHASIHSLRISESDPEEPATQPAAPASRPLTLADEKRRLARQQQLASVGPFVSSIIIIACIAVVIGTLVTSLSSAVDSLASISSQFRESSQGQVSKAVAEAIAPDWDYTRIWSDLIEQGVPNAYPGREAILDYSLLDAHVALTRFPYTNREAHLIRHQAEDASTREYAGFVGLVSVVTDTSWEAEQAAQAAGGSSCASTWTAGFLRLPLPGPSVYILDRITANESVPNVPGQTAGYTRRFHPYVPGPSPHILADAVDPNTPPPLSCPFLMAPLWSPFASTMNPEFLNYSWFGPYNPGIGWGNQFEGSIPLYDGNGTIVGRMSGAVALTSITTSMQRILDESRMFQNAYGLVYTPGGAAQGPFGNVVFAQTKVEIAPLTAATIATIRLTDDGLEVAAPVMAPVPPGVACTMCLDASGALCGEDTCSVRAMRLLYPHGSLSVRDTPNGPEFFALMDSSANLGTATGDGARALQVAANEVKARHGSFCPPDRHEIDRDDLLIDVTPFRAEDYGLPPLADPGYWCQLIVVPRENVYSETDAGERTSAIALGVSISGIVIGVLLLLWSIFDANRSRGKLTKERREREMGMVRQAVAEMDVMSHPMVLVPAEVFAEMTEMTMHEKLRDERVGLITINNLAELKDLKRRRKVIFISHQWLARNHPDPDNAHIDSMRAAVREIARGNLAGFAVWCDYMSISQRHPKLQRLAIASLPVYASSCDVFVAVAPDAGHRDLSATMSLESYCKRGFCRVEMLSKICGSGTENCFMVNGASNTLRKFPLSQLSYFVFEGEFTVEADKEELVIPALGLYSLIIKRKDLPHMREVHALVQANKERFFPPSWSPTFAPRKISVTTAHLLTHHLSKSFANFQRSVPAEMSLAARGAEIKAQYELFGTRLVAMLEQYVADKRSKRESTPAIPSISTTSASAST